MEKEGVGMALPIAIVEDQTLDAQRLEELLQSGICVEKMLGHTLRMTLRFSLSSLHFSLAAAAFQMSVFRPAPVGRSVGKLL